MSEKLLIVSDLDGTLLGDKKKGANDAVVSDFNKKAIKAVEDAGHIFCIATGRSWKATQDIYESTGINTVCVNANGSFIHNPKDKEFSEIKTPLGKDLANELLSMDWMKDNVVRFIAQSLDAVIKYTKPGWEKDGYNIPGLEKVSTDKLEVNHEVVSVTISVTPETDTKELEKLMEKYSDKVKLTTWGLFDGEDSIYITINSNVCKKFGLEQLGKYYGIKKENIISFGDQLNDLSMTKWAGRGYVMKNGNEVLKKNAFKVLDKTNDEDGVGHKLMEILEGNI